jgi:hypothetical protein
VCDGWSAFDQTVARISPGFASSRATTFVVDPDLKNDVTASLYRKELLFCTFEPDSAAAANSDHAPARAVPVLWLCVKCILASHEEQSKLINNNEQNV